MWCVSKKFTLKPLISLIYVPTSKLKMRVRSPLPAPGFRKSPISRLPLLRSIWAVVILRVTAAHDLDGRVSQLTVAPNGGGAAVQDLAFAYDPNGNILSINDGVDAGRSQVFQYDALDRLTRAVGLYGAIDYSYDLVGNRTAVTRAGGVGAAELCMFLGRLRALKAAPWRLSPTRVTGSIAGHTARDYFIFNTLARGSRRCADWPSSPIKTASNCSIAGKVEKPVAVIVLRRDVELHENV